MRLEKHYPRGVFLLVREKAIQSIIFFSQEDYINTNRTWKSYWLISINSFSSASVVRGMYKQSWPSECLLVLTNSWSLNSVKWEFNVSWLLTRKRSLQTVYKLLIGIPEKERKQKTKYIKTKIHNKIP